MSVEAKQGPTQFSLGGRNSRPSPCRQEGFLLARHEFRESRAVVTDLGFSQGASTAGILTLLPDESRMPFTY